MTTTAFGTVGNERVRNLQSDVETAFVVLAPRSIREDYDSELLGQLEHIALENHRRFFLCAPLLPLCYKPSVTTIRKQLVLNAFTTGLVHELWTYGAFAVGEYRDVVRAASRVGALICNQAEKGSTAYRYVEMHISWQTTIRRMSA